MSDAQVAFINVPAKDLEKSRRFYEILFDSVFARSLTEKPKGFHMPVSCPRTYWHVTERTHERETTVVYVAIRNLKHTLKRLVAAGGEVVSEPRNLRISGRMFEVFKERVESKLEQVDPGVPVTEEMGHFALLKDPEGNVVGVMELAKYLYYHFGYGRHRKPATQEQLEDHLEAIGTGREVFREY